MLDTRRLGIPGLEGWEIDARCRVFRTGEAVPVENEWPYVTIEHHDLALSFKVAEAAALAFLGEEGCSDVYRELYSQNLKKGNARTKQIALEKGLSEWIVLAAARSHFSQFRLTVLLQMMRWGRVDETMKLHTVEGGRVESYATYPVDGQAGLVQRLRKEALFDHVINVAGQTYRLRQTGGAPLARDGDTVSFRYRLDQGGGRFVVRTSFRRVSVSGQPNADTAGRTVSNGR